MYKSNIPVEQLDNGKVVVYLTESWFANDLRHGRSQDIGTLFEDLDGYERYDKQRKLIRGSPQDPGGGDDVGVMKIVVPKSQLGRLEKQLKKQNIEPNWVAPEHFGYTARSTSMGERLGSYIKDHNIGKLTYGALGKTAEFLGIGK